MGPGTESYCFGGQHGTYHGLPAKLYRNNRDGTFTDISQQSGIGSLRGRGMGLVCFDFNNDGLMDVFVANDSMENFLWRNNGDGTFTEVAAEIGVACSEDGLPEAGMAADVADLNHDGRMDLFVTHYQYELNRLYLSNEDGTYSDSTVPCNLAVFPQPNVSFGTKFIDFDNDGSLDIVVARGHVIDNVERYFPNVSHAESRIMWWNAGSRFVDVSEMLGKDFTRKRVGRGLAAGDFNNDGAIDLLVSNNGGPAELLRNDGGALNHWLGIRLVGTKSNRDGTGARIKLTAGGKTRYYQATSGGSYESASDQRLLFGLGRSEKVESLEIRWPSGLVEKITSLPVDGYFTLKESEGLAPLKLQKVPNTGEPGGQEGPKTPTANMK
jgi:hypothetical protein